MKLFYKICLSFLFSALSQNPILLAQQPYQPLLADNRTWEQFDYDGSSICSYVSGQQYFLNGSDTLISGTTWHRLALRPVEAQNPNFCPPYFLSLTVLEQGPLLREDTASRKVYYYSNQSGNWQEELLFDFTLSAGDTLQSAYSQFPVVDSVGSIQLLDGSSRRIWYFPESQFYIEGIGGSQGLFGPMILGLGVGVQTQCVKQGSTQLYGDGGNCLPLMGVEIIQDDELVKVGPNPFDQQLGFRFSSSIQGEVQLALHDLSGRLLASSQLQHQAGEVVWELGELNLAAGMYLLQVRRGEDVFQMKVMKSEFE